ncbi:MAG: ATP-binding protein, partial [Kiritimatiellia bacterium]|nr:ATP-binding protein [Kiritimatiellia bacterium]
MRKNRHWGGDRFLRTEAMQALRIRCGIQPGASLMAGISGGADSVALAYILSHLRRPLHLRLVFAHLHHGLRAETADLDEQFVRMLAGRLGVDAVFGQVSVAAMARPGESIEMAARAARRAFF